MALATVGKIVNIEPIPGADFVVSATVVCGQEGKWQAVIKKDEHVLGEKVLVFLQDALLPPAEEWAFMEKSKWRVKIQNFKGVPSECLVLPLKKAVNRFTANDIAEAFYIDSFIGDLSIGLDITELLGVKKYEKPSSGGSVFSGGRTKGSFPAFVPKTDEPNFQKMTRLVESLATGNTHYYITEKADGTSCTVYRYADCFGVCSRNLEIAESNPDEKKSVYWGMVYKYRLHRLLDGYALQFEIVGPGINKNPMGLQEHEIRVFSLYDIARSQYVKFLELNAMCSQLNLPMAKLLYVGNKPMTVEDLRQAANITYDNGKNAEGIVVRSVDSSWSFKVINMFYKE